MVVPILKAVAAGIKVGKEIGKTTMRKIQYDIPTGLSASEMEKWLENKINYLEKQRIPGLEREIKNPANFFRKEALEGELTQERAWLIKFKEMLNEIRRGKVGAKGVIKKVGEVVKDKKNVFIFVGIGVGIVLLIVLIFVLVKK